MKVTQDQLEKLGESIGMQCVGGECIELIGDVGTGKTTFTKAFARGLQVSEDVQSPSFTISREYPARDNLTLAHYDFYRLSDAGVTGSELAESSNRTDIINVIEWAETVRDVLPEDRIQCNFAYDAHDELLRDVFITLPQKYNYIEVNV